MLTLALAVGCAERQAGAPSRTPALAPSAESGQRCEEPNLDRRPLVLEWPPPERAKLERALGRGVVAVSFDGCNVTLIAECTAPGPYTHFSIRPTRDELVAHDPDELEARFPLRARALADRLRELGSVHLELLLDGRWQAPAPETIALSGACAQATHVVTGVDTGAYAWFAGDEHGPPQGSRRQTLEHAGKALVRLDLAPIGSLRVKDSCDACAWDPSRVCPSGTRFSGVECALDDAGEAAEAALAAVEDQIEQRFEPLRPGHRYSGTAVEVITGFRRDAAVARELYSSLQEVIDTHPSPESTTRALMDQGKLFHALATALRAPRPPALRMFTDEQEGVLAQAEASDNPALRVKSAAVRSQVARAWRQQRERELATARGVVIDRYARAVAHGNRHRVAPESVRTAVLTLAELTPLAGDHAIASAMPEVAGMSYSPGVFVRMALRLQAQPQGH